MTAQPTSMKEAPPLPPQAHWEKALTALGRELATPLPDLASDDYLHRQGEQVQLNEVALRSVLAERGVSLEAVALPPL